MYYLIFTVDGGVGWRMSVYGRCLFRESALSVAREFNQGCVIDFDKKLVWYKAVHASLLGKYGLEITNVF